MTGFVVIVRRGQSVAGGLRVLLGLASLARDGDGTVLGMISHGWIDGYRFARFEWR